MLALRDGWHQDQGEALLAGEDLGEEKSDALIGVVREAAANSGHVSDLAWARAAGRGWSDEQLAEAFAYLGLTVFTSHFLNYAETELDIPAGAPGSGPPRRAASGYSNLSHPPSPKHDAVTAPSTALAR